jgi:CubicO group peptidase (beta-lactamase class C family)
MGLRVTFVRIPPMLRFFRFAVHIAALSFACIALAALDAVAQQEPYPGLDAYVVKAMADGKVPGLSLAIVRNDSVIYVKAYGVKDIGKPDKVDENTLFEIGSTTKTFTSTLVGIMQTDGKLRFDDRISAYLPDFRLYDPYASAEVTIRDALSHRTGLARGELMWLASGLSRAEIIHRLRFQPPATSFRSAYAYNNPMVVVAGEVAAKAGGSTWEDLIQQRILTPLGMTRSIPLIKDFSRVSNAATPHAMGPSGSYAQQHEILENIGPAGSINSTARDMAQYLRFQMGDGTFNGKRVIATAALREIHTPQMLIGGGGRGGDGVARLNAYGLGFFVGDLRDRVYWNHGGNTVGMTTAMGILPTEKIGAAVLSNLDHTGVPEAVVRYVLERHLKIPIEAGAESGRGGGGGGGGRGAGRGGAAAPVTTSPPLPLTAYEGTFVDSLFGEVTVTVKGDKLHAVRAGLNGLLEPVNRDNFTWSTGLTVLPTLPIEFLVGPDGRANALSITFSGESWRLARRPARVPAGGSGQ